MDRKDFIRTGCIACAGFTLLNSVLAGCITSKHTSGSMVENGMSVDLHEFEAKNGSPRSFVIVHHDKLEFPICVYKIDGNKYNALLMRCTHQGAELQVSGDILTCPAHGSEFDKHGKVLQSPAVADLRTFPVTVKDGKLFIDLRKTS
jgi:nitrite reductase/ring-hydroxylating ferredoxin subunit